MCPTATHIDMPPRAMRSAPGASAAANRTERCKRLVAAIEQLNTLQQEELFKILHKHRCEFTSTMHGILINLTWMPSHVVEAVEEYIAFCNKSHKQLTHYESICDVLNRKLRAESGPAVRRALDTKEPVSPVWLSRDDAAVAEDAAGTGAEENEESEEAVRRGRVSSSMRFYLLKKRYAKHHPPATSGVSVGPGNETSLRSERVRSA